MSCVVTLYNPPPPKSRRKFSKGFGRPRFSPCTILMRNKSSFLATLLVSLLAAAPLVAETSESASARYPLTTCIVSDEPLGDEPVDYVHKVAGQPDRLVRFCCDGCIEDFKAEPAKFLAKLDAAVKGTPIAPAAAAKPDASHAATIAEQKANYPLTVCAVSSEALGSMGEPFDYVHQEAGQPDRLVRMCCSGCLKKFKKEPAKYLARIDAAAKAKGN